MLGVYVGCAKNLSCYCNNLRPPPATITCKAGCHKLEDSGPTLALGHLMIMMCIGTIGIYGVNFNREFGRLHRLGCSKWD